MGLGALGSGCGVEDEMPPNGIAESNSDVVPQDAEEAALDSSETPTADYIGGYLTFTYPSTSAGTRCVYNSVGSTKWGTSWPTAAQNGCQTRVWLYQYANRTGHTLCLSPFTNTGRLNSTWRSFFISLNPSRCP
jgi:hypothetical protein